MSILSTVAGSTVETVTAESKVSPWFQLYSAGGLAEADALCDRAAAVGVGVLMVTVDSPTLGNRERDVRHGVSAPRRVDARNVFPLCAQLLSRPRWAVRLAPTAIRLMRGSSRFVKEGNETLTWIASPFSWDDVVHLRKRWNGSFVVKGVLSETDARRAVDSGADAAVVSNHGGRQLDGAPATLHVLPWVVTAVGGDAEVLVDGGIRRGSHVVAALALGARAVLIGRPYLFGLAAAGE